MSRRDLPRSATYTARDPPAPRTGAASGTYNSRRAVPPPRTQSFGYTASSSTAGDIALPHAMPTPGGRAKPKRLDPFLTRIVVKVDEATERGISEEEGEKKRVELVNVVLDRSPDASGAAAAASPISGGQAVAFALRKRLKSEDEIAVLNTLTLLDELMRTCPYFYRFIANEKFFRRLWRFVVPDYKNGVMSMIPIFGKVRIHQGMRGSDSEISERVRILIRAWAEELSVMHNGRYDPDAGFLIERYNSKRSRVNFPEVPTTPLPWVCPVGRGSTSDYSRSGSSSRRGNKEEKITMTLDEVENTVNLFANIVDNAQSISDLKDEVCSDMAERCSYVQKNLNRMGMNMSKETELRRAVAVSEALEKSLTQYKSSLESGHIVKAIPTVDTISLQSEDEGYDDYDPRGDSSRSLDRYADDSRFSPSQPRAGPHAEESDHSSTGADYHPRDAPYKPRDRSLSPAPRRRESSIDKKKPSSASTEKRSRRAVKKSLNRREKSDSDLQLLAKEKKKKAAKVVPKKTEGLIQLPGEEAVFSSDSDSEQEEDVAKDGSALLAERYASRNRSKKKSKAQAASSSRSIAENAGSASISTATPPGNPPTSSDSLGAAFPQNSAAPSSATALANPAAMYQSAGPGMGYNPMMMVPNPYAMYGSVSPIPMADPMNMYGAYQTVNPAMYYNTVNPQMYATHNMQFMRGMQPGIGQANPSPQPYMQSQDGASSPGQSGHNLVVPAATPNVGQVANQTGSQSQADSQQSTQNVGTLNAGMQASVMPGQAMSSFYSSVPGQNQIMPQAGFPFMMQASSMPVPFPQAAQSDTNQGLDTGAPQPSLQSNSNAQAAAYQSAMHQAAAAYHAAAEAYRSVSGQAPVGATPTNAPANSELDQSKGGLGE